MAREVSTSEALMTDPTTPDGAAYWQQRHDFEAASEHADLVDLDALETAVRNDHPLNNPKAIVLALIAELRALRAISGRAGIG